MSPDELAGLVDSDVRVEPHEKAACVQRWQAAMEVPLAACASCGLRAAPPLSGAPGLAVDGLSTEGAGAAAGGEGDEVVDGSWEHLEVTRALVVQSFPPTSRLVGSDVCLRCEAYPDVPVREGVVGWRAEVLGHRRARGGASTVEGPRSQVRLFGHWFDLDGDFVYPVQQLRTAAPSSAAAPVKPVVAHTPRWFRVAELAALRMTAEERRAWDEARLRLRNMPLLGPVGELAGFVDLSRVRSVYEHGADVYYLHPELVDHRGPEPACLLCDQCARAIDQGKLADREQGVRPRFNVSRVDYGSLARVPELEPLSVLEELLLSPNRLYHVVVKVRTPARLRGDGGGGGVREGYGVGLGGRRDGRGGLRLADAPSMIVRSHPHRRLGAGTPTRGGSRVAVPSVRLNPPRRLGAGTSTRDGSRMADPSPC